MLPFLKALNSLPVFAQAMPTVLRVVAVLNPESAQDLLLLKSVMVVVDLESM